MPAWILWTLLASVIGLVAYKATAAPSALDLSPKEKFDQGKKDGFSAGYADAGKGLKSAVLVTQAQINDALKTPDVWMNDASKSYSLGYSIGYLDGYAKGKAPGSTTFAPPKSPIAGWPTSCPWPPKSQEEMDRILKLASNYGSGPLSMAQPSWWPASWGWPPVCPPAAWPSGKKWPPTKKEYTEWMGTMTPTMIKRPGLDLGAFELAGPAPIADVEMAIPTPLCLTGILLMSEENMAAICAIPDESLRALCVDLVNAINETYKSKATIDGNISPDDVRTIKNIISSKNYFDFEGALGIKGLLDNAVRFEGGPGVYSAAREAVDSYVAQFWNIDVSEEKSWYDPTGWGATGTVLGASSKWSRTVPYWYDHPSFRRMMK